MNLYYRSFIILCLTSFCGGMLLFLIKKEIIMFSFSSRKLFFNQEKKNIFIKKKVLFFNKTISEWKQEEAFLLWSNDNNEDSYQLINSWLVWLYEERVLEKKVKLQSVLLSPSGEELYISFDRSFLSTQASIYAQWILIESLLKTIRENIPSIQAVSFFVDHKPLENPYIDFSRSFPVNGFIE